VKQLHSFALSAAKTQILAEGTKNALFHDKTGVSIFRAKIESVWNGKSDETTVLLCFSQRNYFLSEDYGKIFRFVPAAGD
jgi:hypothetical protein